MKRSIAILLSLLMILALAACTGGKTPEPASGNGVNIRTSPSSKTSSNIVGIAHNGDKFEVTGKSGKWTKVIYKGDTAYIYTSYLSIAKGTDTTPETGTKAYVANTKSVNVRAKASSSSKKLGTADKGATYTALGRKGNWIKVDYDGEDGYIYKKYVKIG